MTDIIHAGDAHGVTQRVVYPLAMQQAVGDLHDAFSLPNRAGAPQALPLDRIALRVGLIREEMVKELTQAISENNRIEMIDALTDTVYVTLGALVEMGHPLPSDFVARLLATNLGWSSPNDFVDRLLAINAGTERVSLRSTAHAFLVEHEPLVDELEDAMTAQDAPESIRLLTLFTAKAITALAEAGVEITPFFDEVQRANMSKLMPDGTPLLSRGMELDGYPEGKFLKGPNYSPPDLAEVYARIYG